MKTTFKEIAVGEKFHLGEFEHNGHVGRTELLKVSEEDAKLLSRGYADDMRPVGNLRHVQPFTTVFTIQKYID